MDSKLGHLIINLHKFEIEFQKYKENSFRFQNWEKI